MQSSTIVPGTAAILLSSKLTGSEQQCERLLLQPLAGNAGDIYISANATTANGFLLTKGTLFDLPITTTNIYIRGTNAADVVEVGLV